MALMIMKVDRQIDRQKVQFITFNPVANGQITVKITIIKKTFKIFYQNSLHTKKQTKVWPMKATLKDSIDFWS